MAISPAVVERYLKGAHFPAQKDDLIEQARKNGAPSEVVNVLEHFHEKEYKSPVDVSKEFKDLE